MVNSILSKSIAILHRREQKYMIHKMKDLEIGYSGYNFLLYLSIHSGTSQKQMCQDMSVDEALAARVMKQLEEKGFVSRRKCEHNARCYEINLTDKGIKIIPQLKAYLFEWWTQLTQVLSEEEVCMFTSCLEKIAVQSISVLKNMKDKE